MKNIIIDSRVLSRVSGLVICGLVIKRFGCERRAIATPVPGPTIPSRYSNVYFNTNHTWHAAAERRDGDIVIGRDTVSAFDSSVWSILDGHAFAYNVVNEDLYRQQATEVLEMLLLPYIEDHVSGKDYAARAKLVARIIKNIIELDSGVLMACMRPEYEGGCWSGAFDAVVSDTDTLLGALITEILLEDEDAKIAERYIRSTGAIHVNAGYRHQLDAMIRACRSEHSGPHDGITAIIYTCDPQTFGACVITFDSAFAEKFAADITPEKIGHVLRMANSRECSRITTVRGGGALVSAVTELEVSVHHGMVMVNGVRGSDTYLALVEYFDGLKTE